MNMETLSLDNLAGKRILLDRLDGAALVGVKEYRPDELCHFSPAVTSTLLPP